MQMMDMVSTTVYLLYKKYYHYIRREMIREFELDGCYQPSRHRPTCQWLLLDYLQIISSILANLKCIRLAVLSTETQRVSHLSRITRGALGTAIAVGG